LQNRLFRESNKTPLYYEDSKRTVYRIKIRDSFLIEEAYNQEAGVIQHIQTFQYLKESGIWGYAFTQEWPVLGQTHQLSYTIPINNKDAPIEASEIGDIALNYRYQLILNEALALSPRFSTLFPTGDYKNGFGSGAFGYQVNIPLSIELSDKWVTHFNLGSTTIPGSKEEGGASADTFGFNYGASIIRLVSENLNLMLETVWNSSESVLLYGTKTRDGTLIVNPGARYAINCDSGLQIVPGIAFPIELGSSENDYGVFVYLSFKNNLFTTLSITRRSLV